MKDLRYPASTDMTMGDDNLTGSYLAIYWVLEGHHDDWNDWSVIQVNGLHRDGRMFAHRRTSTRCSTSSSGRPAPPR